MYTPSTAQEGILGGFIAFGVVSFFGARLFIRGLQNDINDAYGHPVASRAWFLIGGVLFQAPVIAFALFVWRQGFFK
jgi:hypothetical protein